MRPIRTAPKRISFWGKGGWWDREEIRYKDPKAYDMLFKWGGTAEYSDWGIRFMVFSKVS